MRIRPSFLGFYGSIIVRASAVVPEVSHVVPQVNVLSQMGGGVATCVRRLPLVEGDMTSTCQRRGQDPTLQQIRVRGVLM